ncbi:MAG: ribonuclease Z [Deltaproteobacteria bacterium]|nr:ribonuclease Z [Deltaproteobacteria bacterium]
MLLGTGTATPHPLRAGSGAWLILERGHWLVDAGPGTLLRGAQAGVDLERIEGVILTHRHPDHAADLLPLLFALRARRRTAPLQLLGGPGTAQWLAEVQRAWTPWLSLRDAPVLVEELGATPWRRGDLSVLARPAVHPGGALHLRVAAEGRAIAWSGDTGPSPHLAEVAAKADLFLCECACIEQRECPKHLAPATVRAVLDEAQPQLTWLTHLYPEVDGPEALRAMGPHRVALATDLARWG